MLAPLTVARAFTTWHLDVAAALVVGTAAVAYVAAVRREPGWPRGRTAWFLTGCASLLVVRSSCLAVYDHSLFWCLAVQDVLLLTAVPLPLVLGRPGGLFRAVRLPSVPPLVGSVVAVGALLAVYLTPWDSTRLSDPCLFRLTQLVLLGAGTAFLGPLLGDGPTGYGVRTLTAFVDGLLDALPGLAVLASHGTIATSWYASHPRSWGPSAATDQQIGGTAMIALSELVGLPALLVLLVQWVRVDADTAAEVDARLDESPAQADLERPWWERDAGPLAGRFGRPEQ